MAIRTRVLESGVEKGNRRNQTRREEEFAEEGWGGGGYGRRGGEALGRRGPIVGGVHKAQASWWKLIMGEQL